MSPRGYQPLQPPSPGLLGTGSTYCRHRCHGGHSASPWSSSADSVRSHSGCRQSLLCHCIQRPAFPLQKRPVRRGRGGVPPPQAAAQPQDRGALVAVDARAAVPHCSVARCRSGSPGYTCYMVGRAGAGQRGAGRGGPSLPLALRGLQNNLAARAGAGKCCHSPRKLPVPKCPEAAGAQTAPRELRWVWQGPGGLPGHP